VRYVRCVTFPQVIGSGEHAEGVWNSLEAHLVAHAEIVAVDLKRHRFLGPHGEARLVVAVYDVGASRWSVTAPEGLASDPQGS
jgi:hypothetical protein